MYAITGVTGKVGGELARTLIAAGEPVRAVVRDTKKGQQWAELGCEIALAKMEDASALADAFTGATAVFILPPPEFDPEPGYPEARVVINCVVKALRVAKPRKVLCLSTIGADAKQDNLLSQRGVIEEALRKASDPPYDPATRLVHRQCSLGRCLGARYWPHSQLPATDRQGIPNGRCKGRWALGS